MHDSDGGDAKKLREELEKLIWDVNTKLKVILIPVEELEAWLLADPKAIQQVFSMRNEPKISKRPESIPNPKEFLAQIVQKGSKANFLNTIHNKKIAKEQKLQSLDRCPSFNPYPEFLTEANLM